jgi:hypothetical protein
MKYVLTDAAVRKLRGVLAPRSGNTGAGGAATPVSPDDFPPPFTVRWKRARWPRPSPPLRVLCS